MGPSILLPGQFPAPLLDLEKPPEQLFVHGCWPDGPVVAVVGTRSPSLEGARFTAALCAELAKAGAVVASGGAKGIDTAAHRGALDGGGRTLVVAPSGFARPFPEENGTLFSEIADGGGAFVSEYSETAVARRHHFFRRNELLSALSDAIVVAESPYRSGSRNTALWARRLGRPLLVVPHSPWNRRGSGWLPEFRLGAKLCGNARDVLAVLEARNMHAVPLQPEKRPPVLPAQLELPEAGSPLGRAVLAAVQGEPRHLDDLVDVTGAPSREIQVVVTELCLQGRVALSAAGLVSLVSSR